MKYDANPDIYFLALTRTKEWNILVNELKKRELYIREIKLFSIQMPLNEDYNDKINYLKSFINYNYWRDRNPLFMNIPFRETILSQFEKRGLKFIDFRNNPWECDRNNELLATLICPLFVQNNLTLCTNEIEISNHKKLFTFDSENYENDFNREIRLMKEKILKEAENLPE